jgi:hypothetical protein
VETGGGAEEDPRKMQGDLKKVQGDAVGSEGGTGNAGEPRNVQGDTGGSDGGTYREIHRDLGEVEGLGDNAGESGGFDGNTQRRKIFCKKFL